MANSRGIFQHLYEQLKANPAIAISSFELREGVSPETIARIETLTGHPLPPELAAFYTSANGFLLEWQSYAGEGIPALHGWIDIRKLEQLITGEYENLDIDPEELNSVFEETLILDFHDDKQRAERALHRVLESHWGQPAYTTIRFAPDGSISLWYVNDDELIQLPMTFDEYIRFTIETLGFDTVRYYLSQESFYTDPYGTEPALKNLNKVVGFTDVCSIRPFAAKT